MLIGGKSEFQVFQVIPLDEESKEQKLAVQPGPLTASMTVLAETKEPWERRKEIEG